jgi:hypothetical protein
LSKRLSAANHCPKQLSSPYVSGRSRHWANSKNPAPPAVKPEEEESPASVQRGANQVSTRVVRYSIRTPFRCSCGCSSPNPLID